MATSLASSLREQVVRLYCKNGQTIAKVASRLNISRDLVSLIISQSNDIVTNYCVIKTKGEVKNSVSAKSKLDCAPLKCATCPIQHACN